MRVTPKDMNIPAKIGDFLIKPVSWADFPGKVPENTWFLAYTIWNTNYEISGAKGKGFSVKISCTISKNSWHREEDDKRLLRHEYGHYLIACLSALTFRKEANEAGKKMKQFSEYQSFCRQLYKETQSKFAKQQKRYDKETYHYLNEREQDEWEEYIASQFWQFEDEEKKFQERKLQQEKKKAEEEKVQARNQKKQIEKKSLPPLRNVSNARSKTVTKTNNMFRMKKVVDNVIDEYSGQLKNF